MGIEQDWEDAAPDLQKDWDQSAPAQSASPDQSKQGFWDEHPALRTTMRYGLPIAATAATIPFTGGMSLPVLLGTEGIASLGAESINQAVGVNERDAAQLWMAMAAPGIGRSVGGVIASIPKLVPGFGEAVKAAIVPEMRALPEKLLGKDAAEALYAALGQQMGSGTHITHFPALGKAVQEIEKNSKDLPWEALEQKLKASGHDALFNQIKTSVQGSPATMGLIKATVGGKPAPQTGLPSRMGIVTPAKSAGLDFKESRAAVEGLGHLIGSTTDDVERGIYKSLYKAMLSDLEQAPAPASGNLALWKQAREAYKRENAKFSLQEATENAITTKEGIDFINPSKIVDWLRKDKDIKARLTGPEYREVMNTYRLMGSMAGHNMSKFTAMLFGGWIDGGASGALAGYLGAEQLTKAMLTETGRKAVRAMVGDPSRSNFRRFMVATGQAERAKMLDNKESIQLED